MTTDTKKLAEFGAEFLGWEKGCDSFFTPSYLHIVLDKRLSKEAYVSRFFSGLTAPILAHLGKREMEKRGFDNNEQWFIEDQKLYSWEFIHRDRKRKKKIAGKYPIPVSGYAQDENEYIALWSAIEASGEK